MGTKLTLHIDKEIIEKIKIYAMKNKRSISDITKELYKQILSDREKKEKDIKTPIAKKYKGIIDKEKIDIESDKLNYFKEKHVKWSKFI